MPANTHGAKTAKVRDLVAKHPDWPNSRIAEAAGCTTQLVYMTKRADGTAVSRPRKATAKPTGKVTAKPTGKVTAKPTGKATAKPSTNGHREPETVVRVVTRLPRGRGYSEQVIMEYALPKG